MTRIGYARVSTEDQHARVQEERLAAAGCEKTFTDGGVSGKLASRPEWDRCLEYLRPGDTLVTVRLDRIGRSVRNLMDVVSDLETRQVDLVCLDQPIDTTSAMGKMLFTILAAFAQFERDLILERTMDGLSSARARGRQGGAKPKLSARQVTLARQMYDATGEDGKRKHTVEEIAHVLGVTRPTIYRALERRLTPQQAEAARRMHSAKGDDRRSVKQIADRFGVAEEVIRETLGLESAVA